MTVRRRHLGLSAPLLMLALPACGGGPFLAFRDPDHALLLQKVSETGAKKRAKFGELPSAPGESIPLRPVGHQVHAPEAGQSNVLPSSIPSPPVAVKEKPDDSLPADPTPVPVDLPPLVQAVRDFQSGKPDAAVAHLGGLSPPNRDLVMQLMPPLVLAAHMNLSSPDPDETAVMVRQLESAVAVLTRRTGLMVRKAVLCSNVDGFGNYTPVLDRQGLVKRSPYLVYVEVGNVPCEPVTRADGVAGFQNRLDVTMQVTDDLGQPIEIVDEKTGVGAPTNSASKAEFFRSPIHDYHVVVRFWTPSRPGTYTVTVELRDPKSGRVVSRPVPFRVQ